MECCQVYFQIGHQAVFAVHWESEKRCHIHFAVNTINFQDGRKWHSSFPEIKQREAIFNEILRKYQIMATGAIETLEFLNKEQGWLLIAAGRILFYHLSAQTNLLQGHPKSHITALKYRIG